MLLTHAYIYLHSASQILEHVRSTWEKKVKQGFLVFCSWKSWYSRSGLDGEIDQQLLPHKPHSKNNNTIVIVMINFNLVGIMEKMPLLGTSNCGFKYFLLSLLGLYRKLLHNVCSAVSQMLRLQSFMLPPAAYTVFGESLTLSAPGLLPLSCRECNQYLPQNWHYLLIGCMTSLL